MRKWILAAALLCAPAALHANEYEYVSWWVPGSSFSPNLFGCSVTGASCHFFQLEVAYIKRTGTPDPREGIIPSTGMRWRAEHDFRSSGYLVNPFLEGWTTQFGMRPGVSIEQTNFALEECVGPTAICAGVVGEQTITRETPWQGSSDGFRARYGYLTVQYESGETEVITLMPTSRTAVPEPASLALLALGACGLSLMRRRALTL